MCGFFLFVFFFFFFSFFKCLFGVIVFGEFFIKSKNFSFFFFSFFKKKKNKKKTPILKKRSFFYKKIPMVKHNNRIVKNHFRKDWERHVKVWFNQPARKLKRRIKRQTKAAKIFPRPTELLRPLVHAPTLRYNTKIRLGRGFTLDELKLAKIPPVQAKSIGIAIDYRRKNRSLETQRINVQRLQLYKSKVVVFPHRYLVKYTNKKTKEVKKKQRPVTLKLFTVGTPEEEEKATQLSHQFSYSTKRETEPPRAITEKEKTDSAYLTLRKARGQANKVGDEIRKKRQAALGIPTTGQKGKGGKDVEEGDDEEGGKGKGKGKEKEKETKKKK